MRYNAAYDVGLALRRRVRTYLRLNSASPLLLGNWTRMPVSICSGLVYFDPPHAVSGSLIPHG
jgi:hypothetical protein